MRLINNRIQTMKFNEIICNSDIRLPTPQQARLDTLKKQKDNVSKALDSERKRQKVAKAQQNLRNALSA